MNVPDTKTSEQPTGYIRWYNGALQQQFYYILSRWLGYWHTTKETEWRDVPKEGTVLQPIEPQPAPAVTTAEESLLQQQLEQDRL